MEPILASLAHGLMLTGSVPTDVLRFLVHHGCARTAEHVERVAQEAMRVAHRFGEDPEAAATAGWLHDVSAVFPSAERAVVARQFGLPVLPEEDEFPMILHQKLSVVLGRELFGVTDPVILGAVGCHTTLRRDPTRLDLVLFVADKLAWDQAGVPPFLDQVVAGLQHSLEDGALAYLAWMHQHRAALRVVHPWLREAYGQFSQQPWES